MPSKMCRDLTWFGIDNKKVEYIIMGDDFIETVHG